MTVTQNVTFGDLIAQYDDELADLREAAEDAIADAEAQHGDDREEWPESVQQTLALLHTSAQATQQRQHALETIQDDYGSDPFELSMLSGRQLMDLETTLRVKANKRGVEPSTLQSERKALAVDAACESAPEGIPVGEDGPEPSEAPNPLMLALYDQVETLNNAGATDFRAPGFEDLLEPETTVQSDTPAAVKPTSNVMDADESPSPDSGEN